MIVITRDFGVYGRFSFMIMGARPGVHVDQVLPGRAHRVRTTTNHLAMIETI
ncbi:hypothetical protein [Actinopolymorpha sp. B9G3]|uniref:hypothetical protein n=1 Tax=Actinopolymorpha sp. B9G3 TaxID=3158970 RepID=UPI0032D9A09A